jgi:hypothetical protein
MIEVVPSQLGHRSSETGAAAVTLWKTKLTYYPFFQSGVAWKSRGRTRPDDKAIVELIFNVKRLGPWRESAEYGEAPTIANTKSASSMEKPRQPHTTVSVAAMPSRSQPVIPELNALLADARRRRIDTCLVPIPLEQLCM